MASCKVLSWARPASSAATASSWVGPTPFRIHSPGKAWALDGKPIGNPERESRRNLEVLAQLPNKRNQGKKRIFIIATLGNDEIGIFLRRFDEIEMTGPDNLKILGDH